MTGASGFVGRALTAALTERGDTVVPARRSGDGDSRISPAVAPTRRVPGPEHSRGSLASGRENEDRRAGRLGPPHPRPRRRAGHIEVELERDVAVARRQCLGEHGTGSQAVDRNGGPPNGERRFVRLEFEPQPPATGLGGWARGRHHQFRDA